MFQVHRNAVPWRWRRSTAMSPTRRHGNRRMHAHASTHFLTILLPFRLGFAMNRLRFHRETGVSKGLREPNEGPHEPTRCHFDVACANRQHLTLCCTGIGLRELHGHRFITGSRPRAPRGPFQWTRSDGEWPHSDRRCTIGSGSLSLRMVSTLCIAAPKA